jgi:putative transposase
VTQPTYHRGRQQYGRKQIEEARRLTQLEKEIGLLTKLLAVAELEKALLKNLAEGNFRARNAAAGPSLNSRNFTGHLTHGLPGGGPTPPYPTPQR